MIKKIAAVFLTVCITFFVPAFSYAGENKEEYKYRIIVNASQNIVTVYETGQDSTDTAIRAFVCSSGEDTPEGSFETSDKYIWRPLFGNVFGQYATRITGNILFHSVPYYTKDKSDLEYEEYNKLGQTASMGCIRLCVRDAKWIYDNCPSGTKVEIIKSGEQEPLPKPLAAVIDVNDTEKRGWDPTDPDVSNPYISGGAKLADNTCTVIKNGDISINGNVSTIRICCVNGSYLFKISDINNAFENASVPFSYEYGNYNTKNNVLMVNTSHKPTASDLEILTGYVPQLGTTPVLAIYGGGKTFLSAYSVNGENSYSIEDIAKISQAGILWDDSNGCLELSRKINT